MLRLSCYCYLCKQPLYLASHGICSLCLKRLPPLPPCCPRCGLPSGSHYDICGRCLLEPPLWQRLIAVSDYKPPLKQLLMNFKFHRQTQLTRILARLMVLRLLEQRREQLLRKPDQLITVPLHKNRRWQRGFNQTELLATYLSHWLDCRWSPSLLQRVRSTPPQQQLAASERRHNLQQAFVLNGSVAGLHVAVLDDVVTTGSTLTEICRVLFENGAKTVQVWCLCRTLLDD